MSNAFDKASLVMLPHAYEEGKVYSLKPTDRRGDFTFSRGTDTATRVNEQGYIEKETANLLLQSNQFDTTWTKTNTSVTDGQSGYDGTNNAYLLTKSAANARINQSINNDGVQTFSVYAKAGTLDFILLNNSLVSQWFDLSNGSVAYNSSASNTIDAKIEDVGNGWYRCSLTFSSTISVVRIYPSQANADVSGTSGSIYIQDAQLNQGLVAYPYLETTTAPVYGGLTDDMPRLDYSGGATCPSLLLEPSRTNSLEHSEYLNSSQYNKLNTTVIDDNVAVSPEGLQNASKIKSGSSTLTSIGFENTSIASQYRTFSMFAKAGEIEEILIFGVQVAQGVFFNLNDGTISGYYQGNSSQITDAYSVNYGNGWYRYTVIFASNSRPRIFNSLSQQITFTQTTGNGYYAYGLQTEDATYPTSYIPTYGSSQTRAAEINSLGLSPVLSDNYSVFAEVTRITETFMNNGEFIDYRSSSDTNDRLRMYNYNNGRIRFRLYYNDGTNNSFFSNSGDWAKGDTIKFCFTYNNGNIFIYANGEQLHSISQTLNNLNSVNIEQEKFKQLLHFDFTLTEQEAIALTTL